MDQNTSPSASAPGRDVWLAVRRGLMRRCPACGKGHLFDGYLRPAHACSSCGLETGAIRADDGPAWATILLVGHLVSPVFFVFAVAKSEVQQFLALAFVLAIVLGLTLLLLPRMKGLFMAMIWSKNADGEDMSLDGLEAEDPA